VLHMEDYEQIRRKVLIEGLSQRRTARELGLSRKTVSKALEMELPPGYRRSQPIVQPVIDPVKDTIDAWLEEDVKRPRKQRHTAHRIWERLRDEYGFTGSYSAVQRYVQAYQATRGEVYFPLFFGPGEECQVDWGEAWAIINGVERKVQLFCMRLCFSGVCFVRAYERQNQESLYDGHVRGFEWFGGVPRRLAYDNPKTVVITVGKGQNRTFTKGFLQLKSHHLFEVRMCNVGAGNEKGHVENLVKFSQQHFMTPLPNVCNLEGLNKHLAEDCRRDLDRPQDRTGAVRGELLKEEQAHFLPFPKRTFEACVRASTFVSKLALVRFDRNDYSVPVQFAYHPAVIKGFVDWVEIYVGETLVASHDRCYEAGEYVLEYRHYLPLLERKPGGLHNARPFKGEPWGEEFSHLRRELEFRYGGDGTKRFVNVLLLFTTFPEEAVREAVRICVKRRAFSDQAVRAVLTFEPYRITPSLDLSSRPELQTAVDGRRDLSVYNKLLEAEVKA
jgi:transposase